jgi:hypothetical protein
MKKYVGGIFFMFEVCGKFLCTLLGSRRRSSSDNLKWLLRKLGNQVLLYLKINGHEKWRRLKIKGRRRRK